MVDIVLGKRRVENGTQGRLRVAASNIMEKEDVRIRVPTITISGQVRLNYPASSSWVPCTRILTIGFNPNSNPKSDP